MKNTYVPVLGVLKLIQVVLNSKDFFDDIMMESKYNGRF